jgi:hypothetical protein
MTEIDIKPKNDIETNLLALLAPCADIDLQASTLEAFIMRRFNAARDERHRAKKTRLYWSIARDNMTAAGDLISASSWQLLSARDEWTSLVWSTEWRWRDQLASRTGPPCRRRVALLAAERRLQHELRLYNLALAVVNHVLWDLAPEDFAHSRRRYASDIDAGYPLRDLNGAPVFVSLGAGAEANADAGLQEQAQRLLAALLDPSLDAASRLHLTHAYLYPARIEPRHLQSAHEQALVGQWGLFAKKRVPAGTCVGIYGGILLDNAERIMLRDRRYLAKVPGADGVNYFVDGENLMSLMNTSFSCDASGTITGHDPQRTNIRARTFRCRTADGRPIAPIAFFATVDIEQDRELRWNYGYGQEAFADLAGYMGG